MVIPIITAHTIFRNYNPERMRRIITEAVEQSERLDMPVIYDNPTKLEELDFTKYEYVIYANEKADTDLVPDISILSREDILLLTGPEGGFTREELEFLAAIPNSYGVTLGNNILRAETAMAKLISYALFARVCSQDTK
jgi:16S rRNA (uracil1498-N3)-methyltransferase